MLSMIEKTPNPIQNCLTNGTSRLKLKLKSAFEMADQLNIFTEMRLHVMLNMRKFVKIYKET